MCMPIIQGDHCSHPGIIGPYIVQTPYPPERYVRLGVKRTAKKL